MLNMLMCKTSVRLKHNSTVCMYNVSPASDPVSLHTKVHTFLFCSPAEPVPSAPTGTYRHPSSLDLLPQSELHARTRTHKYRVIKKSKIN